MLEVDIANEGRRELQQALSTTKQTSRASKSWIASEPDVDDSISDIEAGKRLVLCTTRVTLWISLVTAILMIPLCIITQAAVVRTAALDSIGDCISSCMALYTSYRMIRLEPKRYPVGQAKFQSIGCLVFSTFMFAIMFGNALGNIEELVQGPEDIAFSAISRFFHHAGEDLGGDFTAWQRSVTKTGSGYVWSRDEDKLRNPLKAYFLKQGDAQEQKMALEMKDPTTRVDIVREVAEYENDAEAREDLFKQNLFLAILAVPRGLLWLYCILYAIPRTGSSVLSAVAADKRNDFLGTLVIITSTSVVFTWRDSLPYLRDKCDPFVSLLLSLYFMYCWCDSMFEHVHSLSQEAASDDICDEIISDVRTAIEFSPCNVVDDDVKVYVSSEKYTVEVTLAVKERAYFPDVSKAIENVKEALRSKRNLDRVLVCIRAVPSVEEKV